MVFQANNEKEFSEEENIDSVSWSTDDLILTKYKSL